MKPSPLPILLCLSMIALSLLLPSMGFGQAISGNLTGTVTDATGAAVNGATVDAVNRQTGQKVTALTGGAGQYLFSNLPIGDYKSPCRLPTSRRLSFPRFQLN